MVGFAFGEDHPASAFVPRCNTGDSARSDLPQAVPPRAHPVMLRDYPLSRAGVPSPESA